MIKYVKVISESECNNEMIFRLDTAAVYTSNFQDYYLPTSKTIIIG